MLSPGFQRPGSRPESALRAPGQPLCVVLAREAQTSSPWAGRPPLTDGTSARLGPPGLLGKFMGAERDQGVTTPDLLGGRSPGWDQGLWGSGPGWGIHPFLFQFH